jgi:hypothetical protein
MNNDLEAAEHAGCMIFDADVSPWRVAGLTWGFPTDPEPRMCLEVASGLRFRSVRVYLEDDIGNRAFEVVGKLTRRLATPLISWVAAHRDTIEDAWVRTRIAKGWLVMKATGKTVVVTAYGGTEHEIRRTLDFAACPVWLDQEDVAIEGTTLILGSRLPQRAQVRHALGRVIWTGADDGSDAGCIPF